MNGPQLIESAIQWLLKLQTFSTVPSTQIYKACDSVDGGWAASVTTKVTPLILIECTSCSPWPTSRKARKRIATVTITVCTHRDDETHEMHDARCREVFGVIEDTGFKGFLNDYPDFTAIDIRFGSDSATRVDRTLETSIELTVIFVDGELT